MMYQIAIWRPLSPIPVSVSRMHPTIMIVTVKTEPHFPTQQLESSEFKFWEKIELFHIHTNPCFPSKKKYSHIICQDVLAQFTALSVSNWQGHMNLGMTLLFSSTVDLETPVWTDEMMRCRAKFYQLPYTPIFKNHPTRCDTHVEWMRSWRLTSDLVSQVAQGAHSKYNTNNLNVVWCPGHVDCACLVILPAVRVLVWEKLLDVSNRENEVCFAEHSHSWDKPAHNPSLQNRIEISKFQLLFQGLNHRIASVVFVPL